MQLVKTCHIHCFSEALSPITHMMGTSGNEAIINRESVLSRGVIRQVPVLSGNAIRHKMVREPGALHLVKACSLDGKLNIDQANYLFNGGSLTESSTTENLARIAEMQELLPLIRLLGGSLRNQVIGGSLIVERGILVCEENRETIIKLLPDEYSVPETAFRPCEDFIDQYQYTRGDAQKRADAKNLISEEVQPDGTNLMIYNGQTVIPGAVFYHGFILQNISPLEIGALLNALNEWDALGGTIGGQARIGHGQLNLSFFMEDAEDHYGSEIVPREIVATYRQHVDANKEKIIAWLNSAFPRKGKGKQEELA